MQNACLNPLLRCPFSPFDPFLYGRFEGEKSIFEGEKSTFLEDK